MHTTEDVFGLYEGFNTSLKIRGKLHPANFTTPEPVAPTICRQEESKTLSNANLEYLRVRIQLIGPTTPYGDIVTR